MTILKIVGHLAFNFTLLFFLVFAVASALEKEKRAFFRSLTSLFLVFSLYVTILISGGTWLLIGLSLAGIFFLTALTMILILSSPKKHELIIGRSSRVDERDVVFARFDLVPETQRFKNYYEQKPTLKKTDEKIRRFPDILTPVHIRKDPILQNLAAAEFNLLENLLSSVDGTDKAEKLNFDPRKNSAILKRILRYFSYHESGICHLDKSFVYSHVGRGPEKYGEKIRLPHPFAVVFAVEMDFTMIAHAPRSQVIVETGRRYVDAAVMSVVLADLIRRMGFSARAHIAGSNYQAMLVPLGWKAGLGELGRLGVLISKKFGPRVRLGCVTTDLPLESDKPLHFGVQDFCRNCKKCAVNCPAQAISYEDKKVENNVLKWSLDREECYKFWRKSGTDCAMCLYVCPYSKPKNFFHDSIRIFANHSRLGQRIAVLGDDLFYGRSPRQRRSTDLP